VGKSTYSNLVYSDLEVEELASHHLGHLNVSFVQIPKEATYLDHRLLTSSIGELTSGRSLEETRNGSSIDDLRSVTLGVVTTLLQKGKERCCGELAVSTVSSFVCWFLGDIRSVQ
jgi:hypothetical protein